MRSDWTVIGIAGATCSGKTTLAERLKKNLKHSVIIKQDDYFLPVDDPRHVLVPEVNHFNWELLTSVDISKMIRDIRELIDPPTGSGDICSNEKKIMIVDGFLIFNCKEIREMCDLKFFLDLNETECRERRKLRTYDPPDVPNYFEKVVWPEYVKSRSQILGDKKLRDSITFIDGSGDKEEIFFKVFDQVKKFLSL